MQNFKEGLPKYKRLIEDRKYGFEKKYLWNESVVMVHFLYQTKCAASWEHEREITHSCVDSTVRQLVCVPRR